MPLAFTQPPGCTMTHWSCSSLSRTTETRHWCRVQQVCTLHSVHWKHKCYYKQCKQSSHASFVYVHTVVLVYSTAAFTLPESVLSHHSHTQQFIIFIIISNHKIFCLPSLDLLPSCGHPERCQLEVLAEDMSQLGDQKSDLEQNVHP